jgi:hypothetical protein
MFASLGSAQGFVYSSDYKGPIHGSPSQGNPLIRESDLLAPPLNGAPGIGPLPPPIVAIDGSVLGLMLYAQCGNPAPGIPCKIEVDAFSRGVDAPITPDGSGAGFGEIFFSVDEYALGIPHPLAPNVSSEAFAGEASADVFTYLRPPGQPIFPQQLGQTFGNIAVLDGDGQPGQNGFSYPGIGCKEPNDPNFGPFNSGDNLDAMDRFETDTMPPIADDKPAFFSLDGKLFDPLEQIFGSDSAVQNSTQTTYSAADILMTTGPGGVPAVYADAATLGLTSIGDDIDAIAVWDNGDLTFQPSTAPYEWALDSNSDGVADCDMVLFSVRRGSNVIGKLDSILGIAIQPGDLLIPPVMGHLSLGPGASNPGIFVTAEAMGLRADREEGHEADDLDGVDVGGDPFFDCNGNDAEDAEDISNGTSDDFNANGIPDECEEFVEYCNGDGSGTASPCGNDNDGSLGIAGAENGSSAAGGALRATGSASVTSADFQLHAEGLVPDQPGLYFQGNNMINGSFGNQFGDGLRCAGGGVVRLEVKFADSSGTSSTSIDLISKGGVSAGDVRNYQIWYRDPSGTPCGAGFNLSNGVEGSFSS